MDIRDNYTYLLAIQQKIEHSYKYHLKISELARSADVSISKLEHDFRSYFGHNLRDYQTKIRIVNAKKLLETKLPIKRIALEIGYSSGESFARIFKKSTGHTPSVYRKNLTD